jgi:uncharacterized protein YdeI (YjbR/CyaY-like superfamily)
MSGQTEQSDRRPVMAFETALAWREWLEGNHDRAPGVWAKIAKKGSGIATVTYQEALEDALCFGWIDGQKRSYDGDYFIQKFTPRTKRSVWSKRNQEIVARQMRHGRMQPAGRTQIDLAKADGRWARAYDSPKNMTVPEDFLRELSKNKQAGAFFQTLDKANTFAIAWRLETAKKPETRQRRMRKILGMLSRGEKLH